MPSTRDIRRRIKSVKNTAQITKAMQMVASSKMRKAQLAALAGRPYATLMNDVLSAVTEGAGEFLFDANEGDIVQRQASMRIQGKLTLDFNGQQMPGKLDLKLSDKTTHQP